MSHPIDRPNMEQRYQGSWVEVQRLKRENAALAAEVQRLKTGIDAINAALEAEVHRLMSELGRIQGQPQAKNGVGTNLAQMAAIPESHGNS